ncbi:Retrovirus-related Pol polyprotein [Labeo rohita]|uniref:Gypsy retrotransposon integrase-like protein 1 n=1 Tax=Labeo rohita TaxID=84645 RepID=A0ABQ8KYT9_LABRO|nr:Retrovirus-related Pol polyprotein [Labeo rohita]
MKNPTTMLELVEAIELADAVHHRDAGERALPFPQRVIQERRAPEGTQRPVSRPTALSPQNESMPTAEPVTPPRTWLAGCILHRCIPPAAPEADVTLNGKPVRALLDSGSAVTLMQARLCPPRPDQKTFLPITCVHGDTRQIPARRVTISTPHGTCGGRPIKGPARTGRGLTACSPLPRNLPAQEGAVSTGSGHKNLTAMPRYWPRTAGEMQVARGGSFAKEQREDDRLKHCWTQVRQQGRSPSAPSSPALRGPGGGRKRPLPSNGQHLGVANTIQRISDRFHRPGLEADVRGFCQACPTCQITAPRTPPPSPLIPLPIIEVPFERIGMDLVGPLPKSARGHEHILVVVDYATRYPEAVPLRKATAKAVAQELFLLASRVGLPAEILTDQGTPFMSRLMADFCRLLRVKQLRTTVYHPQTDGLVERFNQTLKQMLRRVAAEDKRDWDLMIPYVLFGIREVPQASTGFTPFKLLFGCQPRGLLDVAREAWEQQPAPHRTVVEHIQQMRERIDRIMPLVREHLSKAQQAQQPHYNRVAQPREFQPGDRVMVLVPNSACKFLASWQGPYTVVEKLGPVTYRIIT